MASFFAYILWCTFLGSGLTRAVTYEGSSWHTPLTFDHGYVLVWGDPQDYTGRIDTLALYGPDSHKLYAAPFPNADGVSASALSFAIDRDGTVAVVYRDATKPRARHGIAVLSKDGKSASFVSTDPYIPGHICFARDGSIWTAGTEGADTADFLTLRKHSRSGAPAAAFLPLSEITSTYDPNHHFLFHQMIGGWRMAVSRERIGTIADQKPVNQWMEFDFEGKPAGRWDLPERGFRLAAFTTSGAVYGQLTGTGKPPQLLALDKTTGKWNDTGANLDALLLAADGDDLVYKLKNVSGNVLVWIRMRAQWGAPAAAKQ